MRKGHLETGITFPELETCGRSEWKKLLGHMCSGRQWIVSGQSGAFHNDENGFGLATSGRECRSSKEVGRVMLLVWAIQTTQNWDSTPNPRAVFT
jgi:hypothetical protein